MIAALTASIDAAIAGHRAALAAEYGWTQLAVHSEADAPARVLRLRGQVALPRVTTQLARGLAPLLPPGWRLDVAGVHARAPLGWRATGPGVTRLWRTPAAFYHLSHATCAKGHVPKFHDLTSELLPGDGAVELLAELRGAALVRAGDGTVGWLRGPLLPAPAPVWRAWSRPPAALALRRLAVGLRGYLGVRYQLGGTTRRHIDCSGLVQRCVRQALGLVLPRHSTDQLAAAVAPAGPLGEPGDLLFMTGSGLGRCHVGVVLRGPRPGARTLLHASSRRGCVVEEPLDACLARVGGVRHVELAQLLELRR